MPMAGRVSIIGAGPGPADLLTVRAARLLRAAEVVLHDDLVSPDVLSLCSAPAHVINVGKRCGKAGYGQQQINLLMIEHVRRGRAVARLKSGDPSIFGRLGEELDALRKAAIPFEIVPGVTAVTAAAAAAELTLTDRRSASALLVVTAHAARDTSPRPLLEPRRTTLAVYMPGPDYAQTAHQLVQSGIDGGTPCVVVSNAYRPAQRVQAHSLSDLESGLDVSPPAVLIIGRVAQTHVTRGRHTALTEQDCVSGATTTIDCPAQPPFPFSHPSC